MSVQHGLQFHTDHKGIKYLLIDSRDRLNINDDPSLSRYQFDEAYNNIKFIKLLRFSMLNTYYNITTTNNAFRVDSTDTTIPVGIYDLPRLLVAVKSAIDTVITPDTCTIALNTDTYRLDFTGTTSFTVDFSTALNSNSLFYEMGFESSGASSTATGTSFSSPNVPQIQSNNDVYINFSNIGGKWTSSQYVDKGTFVILKNVNKGDLIEYSANDDYNQIFNSTEVDFHSFEIRLTKSGNELLTNTSDYIICLALIF